MEKDMRGNLRDIYANKAISQVPRLLTLQDRNKYSSTYGCFFRTYWLDKTSDFPSALAQFGTHTLALVYSYKIPNNIYFKSEKIKEWCIAGMDYWTQIQKKDGSFDEFYVNEHGWAGPTGFLLYALLESYKLLEKDIPPLIADNILDASLKAAKYLARYDEPGILANHHAIAMSAIYSAYHVLKEEKLLKGFNDKLDYFLTLQSNEGWSLEYDGADLGYLSATISFLGKLHKMYKDERLFNIVKKAIDFTSYFAYPNGYYAGSMGSRQTLHFYPHGYEIFSREIPLAGAIADKMLQSLKEGKLVPPEIMADRYFLYRIPEFLLSYLDYKPRERELPKLPYEYGYFSRYFDDARIFTARTPEYYMLVNLDKGGVIKIFNNSSRLVYNDDGIIGRLNSGMVVTSQWVDKGYKTEVQEGKITISGNMHKVPAKLFTPLKGIIFNSLMLSIGWSTKIAYLMKKNIRKMLIFGSKSMPVRFKREINYSEVVEIIDTVNLLENDTFKSLDVGDEFFVRYVPQSMYFQPEELKIKGFALDDELLHRLNEDKEIVIRRVIDPEKEGVKYVPT